MKPVFKCEYCNFMGDEDQVREHEPKCLDNYDRRSFYTCKNRHIATLTQFQCECGKEIPEGNIYEFCDSYERKEKINYDISNIFGDLFGGGF